jgi:hypothetical protein
VAVGRDLRVERSDGVGVVGLADEDRGQQWADPVALPVELDEPEPAAGEDGAIVGLRRGLVRQLFEAVGR